MNEDYKVFQYGNSAVCVEFSKGFKEEAWLKAHSLAEEMEGLHLDGVINIIPTYTSVVIDFDVYVISILKIKEYIHNIVRNTRNEIKHRVMKYQVPVVYGGKYGPDLPRIAEQMNTTEKEVVQLHCKEPSRVLCFTSPAGQPLMNRSLLPKIVSRVEIPYTKIPQGSVGVVADQTTVYARESPGGWKLIGRTPIDMTNPAFFPPTPVKPGDLIEFFEINQSEWNLYKSKTIKDLQVN